MVIGIGIVTARRVRHAVPWPCARIPFFVRLQQGIEGLLWLLLPDRAPTCIVVLTQVCSGFSQLFWPVFIPVAMLLLETVRWRRIALLGFCGAGVAMALFLLVQMLHQPVVAQIEAMHIRYIFHHYRQGIATVLYLLSACIAPMLSSHRPMRIFGVAATLSMTLAFVVYEAWFISVWCFFAALLSATILLQFPRAVPRRTGA